MPLPPEAASCAVCGARVPLIARPDLARRASDGTTTGRRTAVPSPPLRDEDDRVAAATRRELRDALPAPVARRADGTGPGAVPFGPAVRRRAVEPPAAPLPSVGRRVLAQLVDAALTCVGAGAAAGAATVAGAPPAAAAGTAALLVAVGQVVAEGVRGTTAGAAALGLRTVTHATGGAPGVGRALVRQLVVGLGALVLLVGSFLVAASAVFDRGPQRRGWHDRASGTRVVDAATPAAARGPAARTTQERPVRARPDGGAPSGPPPAAVPLTGARAGDAPPAAPPTGTRRRDAVPTDVLPVAPPPPGDAPSDAWGADAGGPDAPPADVAEIAEIASAPWSAPAAAGTHAAPPTTLPPAPGTAAATGPARGAAGAHAQPRGAAGAHAQPPGAAHRPPADAPGTAALDGTDPRPSPVAAAATALDDDELVELEHTRVRDPAQLRRRAITLALLFDTGPRVRVVGRGLAGRGPRAEDGADILHVVAVDDPARSVSRVHLEFGPEAPAGPDDVAGVWVLDRGSTNGTVVVAPDGDARVLPPGRRAVVRAGWTLRLGDRVVRVEDD